MSMLLIYIIAMKAFIKAWLEFSYALIKGRCSLVSQPTIYVGVVFSSSSLINCHSPHHCIILIKRWKFLGAKSGLYSRCLNCSHLHFWRRSCICAAVWGWVLQWRTVPIDNILFLLLVVLDEYHSTMLRWQLLYVHWIWLTKHLFGPKAITIRFFVRKCFLELYQSPW